VNCTICQRPLFEGASACVVCGAPVAARVDPITRASVPAPARASSPPHVAEVLTPAAYAYTPPHFPAPPQAAHPLPQSHPHSQSQRAHYAPPAPLQAPYRYAPPLAIAPNNIATASFVCGVFGLVPLWIGFALCILAIIFGVLGIQRAAQLPGERGKGLAIAGLVLGILFILPAGCGL